MSAIGRLIEQIRTRDQRKKAKGYLATIKLIRERQLTSWSDQDLFAESMRLRQEAQAGTPLTALIVDAYALVCEVAKRTLGLEPYDVQLMAALALHEGLLIEQHTGEGKTLSAVMPAYLHALTGKGVHVLTFNDYLAKRDAGWMGPIYESLGLTVCAVQADMTLGEKRNAYAADITYVTAKEAGFDFLRDSIALETTDIVHRPFHYVIVDEADSLLLDEARVPLVIAGDLGSRSDEDMHLAAIVKQLKQEDHYEFDEFRRNVYLSEAGAAKAEVLLRCGNLYDHKNSQLLMSLNCALHAELLLQKDVDYLVREGRIELIDEYTGRVAENRNLPDGLQAALDAKEGIVFQEGGKVLGTITLQHFLSLYPKISGMTATAYVSANEFYEIYRLEVMQIPPNRPNIRIDHPHRIFTHKATKLQALVQEISSVYATGRPILVGTSSVSESEELAEALADSGVPCQVLNAKNDAEEAAIVAKAGVLGSVTVSTNMAGRGVDIRLGGGKAEQAVEIAQLGGLYVIGTNLHQSVRIDNQLRGRSGRQGDPGSSIFFISLEDELMLQFGIKQALRSLRQDDKNLDEGSLYDKISHIQRVIMGQNFHIRQELNSYSDMLEEQRRILYDERLQILLQEKPMSLSERRVRLCLMDKHWSDHLAYTSYIRESIHLASLTNRNPIDEFHTQMIRAYDNLATLIDKEAARLLRQLNGSDDPNKWDAMGLRSPVSTWTYMVNDQYVDPSQNRGSWGPITLMAYWLRKLISPIVK